MDGPAPVYPPKDSVCSTQTQVGANTNYINNKKQKIDQGHVVLKSTQCRRKCYKYTLPKDGNIEVTCTIEAINKTIRVVSNLMRFEIKSSRCFRV